MYKILRRRDGQFSVEHYATGDPLPTATTHVIAARPLAWVDAFGRAAKASLIHGEPQVVQVDDGRRYRVTVERLIP